MLVYLMMELEEKLDLELSTDDFYDHPTVEALSRFLADKRALHTAAPRAAEGGAAQMDTFRSLVALLARRAADQGDDRAYVFVSDRGTEEATLTFRQLHDAATAPAARLAATAQSGDRADPGVSARHRGSWWRSSAA